MQRTYGTYTFRGDQLAVRLEPMAAVRFKRVFERASKHAAEWITLLATPENARELEWFMGRYPVLPEAPEDADRLDALAREFDRSLELVARILAPDYVPPMVALALPPRPYQLTPAAMLAVTGGVLVGDEVGLGKTCEAIVALAEDGALPALVVTKTDLPRQWEREVHRFAPALSTFVLGKGRPSRYVDGKGEQPQDLAARIARGDAPPDVVITSYSKLSGWAEWLVKTLRIKTAIWDEVQEFRNGTATQRGAAAMFIAERARRRMGLSATPIHNKGSEIHPVMETIVPGALGSYTEFMREWCPGGGLVEKPDVLGSYLRERGIFIRRTKAEVGRELPPLTIAEQFCDADPKVLESFRRDTRAVELAKFVLSGTRQAFQASGEFDMRMRQWTGVAKAPFVAAFVNMLLESDEPVVLYGWHHEVYALWREQLAAHRPAFFTGKQTAAHKDEAVRAFREGETKLFIISLRAGAGLDGLQFAGCSNVVFGELDWSPAVHEQAIGRVRRDGNDAPVTAWFMVSEEGSDPVMAERLGVKRGQLEGIRDPQGGVVAGQLDGDAMKRLAADFLTKRGIALPDRAPDETPAPQAREIELFPAVSATEDVA